MPATATKPAKGGSPAFTTEVNVDTYVDVTIEPEELEEAGWVYIGDGNQPLDVLPTALALIRKWHNDTHPGPARWCSEPLCKSVRDEMGAVL